MEKILPPIPAKRYFTIGEVSSLCGVKPHVLRYWEQEFAQLRPMKRRGNRRYYQHHEVLMIRKIRDLLYDQGFTISGARNKLHDIAQIEGDKLINGDVTPQDLEASLDVGDPGLVELARVNEFDDSENTNEKPELIAGKLAAQRLRLVRRELAEIRDLLCPNG